MSWCEEGDWELAKYQMRRLTRALSGFYSLESVTMVQTRDERVQAFTVRPEVSRVQIRRQRDSVLGEP